MEVNIADLSGIIGVENNLCYGIARTNQMADKKAQSWGAVPTEPAARAPTASSGKKISSRSGSRAPKRSA